MSGYTKLFSRILDSTIWQEDSNTRVLWITLLAMADRDGIVQCTVPGLASRAHITLADCEHALHKFQQPDKYSWSQENEGRRIRQIDGGWELINYRKFREMMSRQESNEKAAIRMRRMRERKRNESSHIVTPVTSGAGYDIASASASASTKENSKAYSAPVTSEENPPENLHPLNYARKLLEDLCFPATPDNLRIVGAAVEAEIKSGKTGPSAYEFILAGAKDARDEGLELNRFFFADAKYRAENRKNGHRASNFETVAERNKRAFDEADRRALEQNGDVVRKNSPARRN